MGAENNSSLPTSPTPAAPVNKFPHVPVNDGKVLFYAEIDGKSGAFVARFSALAESGKTVLENQSFDDGKVAIDDKMFASTYGPLVQTSKVYLTLDDYRANKSIPFSDVRGALGL